ncbi:protein YmgL, partial [Escherichia sp. TWPC-MK]
KVQRLSLWMINTVLLFPLC